MSVPIPLPESLRKIEPYSDPYKKFRDEQAHLDTDELRHLIKPIIFSIADDFKGEEHIYCDPSQLDENGKYRRPKLLIEAENRGFTSGMDMIQADKKAEEERKKAEEEKKNNELIELRETVRQQTELLQQLLAKIQ